MKRIILKFVSLLILITAGFLFQDNSPVSASSCWVTAYNTWMSCDNAYGNTLYEYANRNYYCNNNSASNCSAIAGNYCSSEASTACANDPDPQCYNNSYNSCYLANYQSCHTQTNQECQENLESSYNNRGFAYASCLGIEGNGNSCVEQLQDSCQEATNRATSCYGLYSGEENADALYTCLSNSGAWQCQ